MRTIIRKIIKFLRPIKVSGHGNELLRVNKHIRKGNTLTLIGNNNKVEFVGGGIIVKNLKINIYGDNNTLIVEPDARLLGPCEIEMHGNAAIIIGRNAGIRGVRFLAKDAKIEVGELAMFSYGINIRNTDSHRIFSLENPDVVTNSSSDIKIGKHAWICMNATILKGVSVGDNAIVAYGAVLTRDCPANSIAAGNPAKVVKNNITWDY